MNNSVSANGSFWRGLRSGFTLLELLFAIVLVGILAVIVATMLKQARASADGVRCINHLKECGRVVLVRAADHGGVIESSIGGTTNVEFWNSLVYDEGYVADKSIFRCPIGRTSYSLTDSRWKWQSYGLNMQANEYASIKSSWKLRIVVAGELSRYPLIMDSGYKGADGKVYESFRVESTGGGISFRHPSGANVFYLDGHVAPVRQETAANDYGFKNFFYE